MSTGGRSGFMARATLETYRLEGERWMLLATWRDDARIRARPFDAIELKLAALWAR